MQKVKELIPNLNPEQAMGDFESSSGKAIRSCWPQVQIGGCQFHFSQNLYRKIQKLGLTELYKDNKQFNKWVKKIMTLSYVPTNQMHKAVDSLFQENFEFCLTASRLQRQDDPPIRAQHSPSRKHLLGPLISKQWAPANQSAAFFQ